MSIEDVVEPTAVPTEPSKKRKSERTPEERAAKKARKQARALQRQAQATPPETATADAATQQYLKDKQISYEPAAEASQYPPFTSFQDLPLTDDVRPALAGFKQPTPVQAAAFGVLLREPRDVIGIAETGSGKTLAFGLPAIRYLQSLPTKSKKKARHTNVLVLAPTRELAMQTHEHLDRLAQLTGFSALCIYGGVPKPAQVEALKKGPRIVVGTPGRIIDLCNDGALDLSRVAYLVLDEADRMLDSGFENDVRTIIAQCRPNAPPEAGAAAGADAPRQTVMFSATWPASVRRLAADFMRRPLRVTVGSEDLTASASVAQAVVVLADTRLKDQRLLQTLREHGWAPHGKSKNAGDKVLVFALYKKEASRVEGFLRRQGYAVSCLQGDMSQAARTQALHDFKVGKTTVLVATDVAARGLDIPKVELVVNNTFPLTIEDYIHRIGRTGRAGRPGRAVTFFTAEDKAHAGELQRVLRDAGAPVPADLKAFGGTIKKKTHAVYGDHYDESLAGLKGKKITFD